MMRLISKKPGKCETQTTQWYIYPVDRWYSIKKIVLNIKHRRKVCIQNDRAFGINLKVTSQDVDKKDQIEMDPPWHLTPNAKN